MNMSASAPGKLVMAGDYAVLEGAPAVVIALDRRAHVELGDSNDDTFCVDAPDLDIHQACGRLELGAMRWATDSAIAGRLNLVASVLEYLAQHDESPKPQQMALDTSAFFADGGKAKLGLGSSAALTVALTGALRALNDQAVPDLTAMIAMHRHMQGGRGSGLDVATSLLGGALIYRLHDGQPQTTRATWPQDLSFCCVWSGRSASTGAALGQLAIWRNSHAAAYRMHMSELTAGATTVAEALEAGDAATMAEGMSAYADSLIRFGEATGIDIVCAEHRSLMDHANDCGVAYKTCGAGGGDVGVAVSTDADRLNHFARQATAAGFHILETGIDASGLSVQATTSCHRRQPWTTYA